MLRTLLFTAGLLTMSMTARADTVKVYAAGSLRAAITEIVAAFELVAPRTTIETTFGASGLLRERIAGGETAHVFASADTGHPQRLAELGIAATPVTVFARNKLCGLARQGLAVTPESLLDVLLDPQVRVGTSTPKADPAGDYAFALFEKAETIRPGARQILEAKALRLTGGPTSECAPDGRNLYGWVMDGNKADVFLTYCTNSVQAKSEVPTLKIVDVPMSISVGADYGLVVLKGAPPAAMDVATFIASKTGRALLDKHGFGAGD